MATKTRVSESYPVDASGNKVTNPFDAVGVRWNFFDTDEQRPDDAPDGWKPAVKATRTVVIADLIESAPNDVAIERGLAIHGLKALGGESYASREKLGKDAWDMLDARVSTLASGEWQEGRGESVASSTTLVVEAACRVLQGEGVEITDAIKAALVKATESKEARKAALDRPDVKAAYLQIRAEREAERAKAAAAKAGQAETGTSLAEAFGLA